MPIITILYIYSHIMSTPRIHLLNSFHLDIKMVHIWIITALIKLIVTLNWNSSKKRAGVVTLYLAAIRENLFGVVEDILITFNPFLIIYVGAACSYSWRVLILYKVSSSIIIIDMDIFLVVLQRIGI